LLLAHVHLAGELPNLVDDRTLEYLLKGQVVVKPPVELFPHGLQPFKVVGCECYDDWLAFLTLDEDLGAHAETPATSAGTAAPAGHPGTGCSTIMARCAYFFSPERMPFTCDKGDT